MNIAANAFFRFTNRNVSILTAKHKKAGIRQAKGRQAGMSGAGRRFVNCSGCPFKYEIQFDCGCGYFIRGCRGPRRVGSGHLAPVCMTGRFNYTQIRQPIWIHIYHNRRPMAVALLEYGAVTGETSMTPGALYPARRGHLLRNPCIRPPLRPRQW